jgi:DNA-binding MurR/RpiR family transcriptional regulator
VATTAIPVSALLERVQAQRGELSPAAQRVVTFLLENPETTVFSSSAELGRLTRTSDATVIRTIKRLGYAGLDELRDEVRQAIDDRLNPVRRLQRSLDWAGADPETVLAHTLDLHTTLLEDARRTLSPTQFTSAVQLLDRASSALVFGIGPLGCVAEYLALRLVRVGVPATGAVATGFRLADDLLNLTRHHVVVVFAYDSIQRETEVVLKQATQVGAPVILVTDSLGRVLGSEVQVVLSAPVVRSSMVSSFTTSLLIADALALSVASRSRRRSERCFEELERLRILLGRQDRMVDSRPLVPDIDGQAHGEGSHDQQPAEHGEAPGADQVQP